MFLIPAFKSNDYNMNLLYIVTGDKWLKNETACLFLSQTGSGFQILSGSPIPKYCPSNPSPHPPPTHLPDFLETRWPVVNEQEDDSVILQTNPFTNQSMVARKSGN